MLLASATVSHDFYPAQSNSRGQWKSIRRFKKESGIAVWKKNIYVKSSNGTQVPLSGRTRFDSRDSGFWRSIIKGSFRSWMSRSIGLPMGGALGDAVTHHAATEGT